MGKKIIKLTESELYNIVKRVLQEQEKEEEDDSFYRIDNENKKLLDILENDKISINTKLNLLEDNTIKPINLTAGGLMDDFNFIM